MHSATPGELIRRIAIKCSTSWSGKPGEIRCDFCGTRLTCYADELTPHKEYCPIMGLQVLLSSLSSKLEEITGLEAALVEAMEKLGAKANTGREHMAEGHYWFWSNSAEIWFVVYVYDDSGVDRAASSQSSNARGSVVANMEGRFVGPIAAPP